MEVNQLVSNCLALGRSASFVSSLWFVREGVRAAGDEIFDVTVAVTAHIGGIGVRSHEIAMYSHIVLYRGSDTPKHPS